MSKHKQRNNLDQVRASLTRTEAIRKSIKKEATFNKNDGLESIEIQIHPNQMQMHLFPVFKVEVE